MCSYSIPSVRFVFVADDSPTTFLVFFATVALWTDAVWFWLRHFAGGKSNLIHVVCMFERFYVPNWLYPGICKLMFILFKDRWGGKSRFFCPRNVTKFLPVGNICKFVS